MVAQSFSSFIIEKYGIHIKESISKVSYICKKLACLSCNISYLKCCRDHGIIPCGLIIKSPINSNKAGKILHNASNS